MPNAHLRDPAQWYCEASAGKPGEDNTTHHMLMPGPKAPPVCLTCKVPWATLRNAPQPGNCLICSGTNVLVLHKAHARAPFQCVDAAACYERWRNRHVTPALVKVARHG